MIKKLKKNKSILGIMMLVFLASASLSVAETDKWRNDKPCGRQLQGLKAVTMDGCIKAFCSNLPTEARLCACLKSEETGETEISFQPKNATKKKWNVEAVPPMSISDETFRLDSADLNGDGKEELIFGVMESQGQGMGVQHWTLWTIAGDKVSDELPVSDYGVMSYLTCSPERKGAYLLASNWIEGWEPRRGRGLYIAGQWYKSGCGGFCTVLNRPGIYHRYLYSLEEERGKELNADHAKPVPWHTKKNAHEIVGPYPFK